MPEVMNSPSLVLGLESGALVEHLWAATLEKVAIDQPGYSGYTKALEERGGA